MNLLVLDGSHASDTFSTSAWEVLQDAGGRRGWSVDRLVLREMEIAHCLGCFGCWVKTPGECVIDDEGREVARQIVASDLVIYLTPVTFGGYSASLKNALDRSISIISPMFRKLKGEVHHQKRYAKYPRLLSIGWMASDDLDQEETFEMLIQRNALNMYAPRAVARALLSSMDRDALAASLEELLEEVIR